MQGGDDQYNPQPEGDDDDEDDEEYDPSSFNIDNDAPADSTGDSTAPKEAPKQKTVGGFIVDDEDEEEDAAQPPPSQLNGIESAQSGLGAAAVAQAQDVPPVASETSQDLAAQTAGLNGPAQPSVVPASHTPSNMFATTSTLQPPASTSQSAPADEQGKPEQPSTAEVAASAAQSMAATPQPPQAAAAPPVNGTVPATSNTARLPHDKVGQLEDRITEDARADTDAWMSLIAHYKEKAQYDQMRNVYERFFKVFPDAVRLPSLFSSHRNRQGQ